MLYRPAAAIVFRARLTRPPSLRVPYRARVSRGQSEGAKLGERSISSRSAAAARHPFGAHCRCIADGGAAAAGLAAGSYTHQPGSGLAELRSSLAIVASLS
jgi:hypothetical protein